MVYTPVGAPAGVFLVVYWKTRALSEVKHWIPRLTLEGSWRLFSVGKLSEKSLLTNMTEYVIFMVSKGAKHRQVCQTKGEECGKPVSFLEDIAHLYPSVINSRGVKPEIHRTTWRFQDGD